MHVDVYERAWMWTAAVLIVLFLGSIVLLAVVQAVQPPSHVETVDPTTLADHPEFGNPTVTVGDDGRVRVPVVASMFAFTPDPVEVPAGRPVTFRITSGDVLHGFQVVGTNANTMAIPGYVSQFTVTFPRPGEYLIVCNEYCGLMHHAMVGKVLARQEAP
jgi:cytochrome c oxidase subunit 2